MDVVRMTTGNRRRHGGRQRRSDTLRRLREGTTIGTPRLTVFGHERWRPAIDCRATVHVGGAAPRGRRPHDDRDDRPVRARGCRVRRGRRRAHRATRDDGGDPPVGSDGAQARTASLPRSSSVGQCWPAAQSSSAPSPSSSSPSASPSWTRHSNPKWRGWHGYTSHGHTAGGVWLRRSGGRRRISPGWARHGPSMCRRPPPGLPSASTSASGCRLANPAHPVLYANRARRHPSRLPLGVAGAATIRRRTPTTRPHGSRIAGSDGARRPADNAGPPAEPDPSTSNGVHARTVA